MSLHMQVSVECCKLSHEWAVLFLRAKGKRKCRVQMCYPWWSAHPESCKRTASILHLDSGYLCMHYINSRPVMQLTSLTLILGGDAQI